MTDVIVTNTNATAACNVSLGRDTQAAITGVLCIPPQTTLELALTTGIGFQAGQVVQLANPTAGAAGPISFHIRGVLAPTA